MQLAERRLHRTVPGLLSMDPSLMVPEAWQGFSWCSKFKELVSNLMCLAFLAQKALDASAPNAHTLPRWQLQKQQCQGRCGEGSHPPRSQGTRLLQNL